MPLTISHPAAAIPLKKAGLVLSALIVGCMMPDFEFFLRIDDGKTIGHTLGGLFLFCLPVGFMVLFIFHKLIKFPLLSLVPHNHQLRLYPLAKGFRFLPLTRLINIIISLIIGVGSHLLLDGFTHHDGWFVKHLSILNQPVLILPQGTIRMYFVMQYLLSFIGVLLMVYWYLNWYYKAEPEKSVIPHRFHISRKVAISISMLIFALTSGAMCGIFMSEGNGSVELAKSVISLTAIATVTGLMVALMAFGIMWHFLIPHNKRVAIIEDENEVKENLQMETISPLKTDL